MRSSHDSGAGATSRAAMLARRRLLALMALGANMGAAGASRAAERPGPGDRAETFRQVSKALWIWRTTLTDMEPVARFMRDWRFDTALLSVPPEERASLAAVRAALAPLHDQGVRVLLATGDPDGCAVPRRPACRAR